MKKILCVIILLITCLCADSQNSQKMSHDIRQLVEQTTSGLYHTRSGNQHEAVRAMIRFHNATDISTITDDYGCKVITRIGDIYIADIPVSQLRALVNDGRVERIENHTGGKVMMDESPDWVNLPAVYKDLRLPQAYTGQGVMVGIIDCGLEVNHPNFYTEDGTELRVSRFLDQFAGADETYGQPIALGREYTTAADIKGKAYAGDSDYNYHGTHCLGIAAGTGYTTPYRGVAYEAELTVVNSNIAGESAYGSANELALMKYIFDYADERHLPCVITYSIGFNALPDDCLLFEEAIARMTGPGHIFVTAAGNESSHAFYVGKTKGLATAGSFLKGDSVTTAFLFSHDDFTLKAINIHLDSLENASLGDSLVYVPADGSVEKQVAGKRVKVEKADTCYTISFVSDKDDTAEKGMLLVIEGEDCAAQMIAGLRNNFQNKVTYDPRCVNATNDHSVGLPGCLPSVVTVGALNTRKEFLNIKGDTIQNSGGKTPVGAIAIFSSQGPTLDGLIKPDVVAPGINIHASANSYYKNNYDNVLVSTTPFQGRDYPWIAISGTSMATPCMAGIVALWLQANPELSPDDVKRIIRNTSHPIDEAVPNNTYGYGLVDAYAGLLDILGLPTSISDLSLHQPQNLNIIPAAGGLRLQFDKVPTRPFTVRIYSLTGQLQGEHTLCPTASNDYFLPLSRLSGISVVQVDSPEAGITGSELIRSK